MYISGSVSRIRSYRLSFSLIVCALALAHATAGGLGSSALAAGFPRSSARSGIVPAQGEKRDRTPAQKKLDSQLLYALYRERGEGQKKGVPAGEPMVRFDEKGRAIVSIRARVTQTVLAKIKSLGGEVISSSVRYRDIQAHLSLEKLERLASLKDVYAIMPAEDATTNSALP